MNNHVTKDIETQVLHEKCIHSRKDVEWEEFYALLFAAMKLHSCAVYDTGVSLVCAYAPCDKQYVAYCSLSSVLMC